MVRPLTAFALLVPAVLAFAGCGPNYMPDTYATNAAQQANKVETGVIVGMRPVKISASGTVGGVSGAAAGGVAGSQVGVGPTSTFAAIGGTLLGGIAGVTAEHVVGDTDGFEYVVRKGNNEMVSVVQKEKDKKPLPVGQKVLVIGGAQARIVADYTVPLEGGTTSGTASGGTSGGTSGTASGGSSGAGSAQAKTVPPASPPAPSVSPPGPDAGDALARKP